VPEASAPLGANSRPLTVSGSASVALNPCPDVLLFDPNVSPNRTVSTVPAGTTVGAAFDVAPDFVPSAIRVPLVRLPLPRVAVAPFAGAALFAAVPFAGACCVLPFASVVLAGSEGLLHPAKNTSSANMDTAKKIRRIVSPQKLWMVKRSPARAQAEMH
jgi:hypothetical protein